MTSIKEAFEIVQCMIRGDQIEAAIVDTDTMASLGDVVRAALAQLDGADAREVWRKAGDVPLIKPGASQQYILAVYRKHSGKVYSFAAEYLNDYPLRYDWGCQKDHKGICDGCSEDGCPTTGWYVTEGADDDGYTYHALSLSDGDRIEGWREVPRWEDRSTGLLPDAKSGLEAAARWHESEAASAKAVYSHMDRYSDDHEERTGWRSYKDKEDRHLYAARAIRNLTCLPDTSPGNGAEKAREAALGLLAAEDERQSKLHELLETIREQIRLEVKPEHRPEGLFKNIQDAVYAMRGRTALLNDAAIIAALHSTSTAGETTSSDGGGCMADFSSGDPNNLKELMAGPSVFDPPSEAADVLAMKEACKRAVSECLNQYGRMTFVTEKGWSGLESQILAAIDKLSPEVKAPASPPDVEAIGFAVMSFGKINVTTVSPTRRGALVNWLVSSARIPVFQWTTDDEIESSWRQLSGRDHKCAEVSIAALLDGGRKP